MLPAPAARAHNDAVGLQAPGGTPGYAAVSSMGLLPLGLSISTSSIPGVRLCHWAALEAGLCFRGKPRLPWVQAGALGSGATLHRGVPVRDSRQWVLSAPAGLLRPMALPYLFPPLCSQLHPTLQT